MAGLQGTIDDLAVVAMPREAALLISEWQQQNNI